MVYWISLAWIPKGILSKIQQLCCRFLWHGSREGRTFTWVAWEHIALPKECGGWGIKNLECFSRALATKLGWQILTSTSLWTEVILWKYINPQSILNWIRCQNWNRKDMSTTWRSFLNSIRYIHSRLAWKVGSRDKVRICLDA